MRKQILLKLILLTLVLNSQAQSLIQSNTDSIQKYPNNPKFYYSRGFAYNYNKDYNSAILDFTKAIKLNPKYVEAYKWRGNSYNSIGEYELAIKDYTTAISIAPNDLLLYNFRGDSYASLKKYDQAIESYSTTIRMGKDKFDNDVHRRVWYAHSLRGNAYMELKKYDLAIADFTSNILKNPVDEISLWDRGNCYSYIKNYDLAIKDYEAVLKISPDNKDVEENLERTLAQKENSAKVKSGSKSFQIDSDSRYSTVSVTKGEIITITASGSIVLGAWAGSGGPEGIDGYTSYNRVEGFRHGSLLVRIGDTGTWEAVGLSKKIVANSSGFLQFMVNDQDPSNNSGSFNVDIVIKKR